MPELERVQADFSGRDVAIIGLGTEGSDRVRKFRDQFDLHLALLAGGFGSLAIARNLGDKDGILPYTVLFSRNGVPLHTQAGALRPGQLRSWLEEALDAKPAAP